jgi:hypothetical protein
MYKIRYNFQNSKQKPNVNYSFSFYALQLSVFVGWCTECKDVHGVSNIKEAFLYAHLLYVFTLRNYLLTPWSRVLFETLTGF